MKIEENYFLRSVDELGRVVIPIEIRKRLGIKDADKIKIYIQDEKIVIENKYKI